MRTVLLIDDSKLIRIANERLLVKAGYRVISAADGEEALRKIHLDQERPDVIVLDMMLPKMDGPEVLHALKRDPATARIPVIVLTSLSQKNEARLLSEGAAAFLEKGFLLDNPQPLLDTIAQLTRRDTRTAWIRP